MSTFDNLKNQDPDKALKRLQDLAHSQEYSSRNDTKMSQYYIRNRVTTALGSLDDKELLNLYNGCNPRRKCQSHYCESCMGTVSELFRNNIQRHLNTDTKAADLLHITGVLGLCAFDAGAVKEMIQDDSKHWQAFRRNVGAISEPRFIEISYEFELVNRRYLDACVDGDPYKQRQVAQLNERDRAPNLCLYVHWHGVTDLTKEELADVFKKRYFVDSEPLVKTDNTHGLYAQVFRETKALSKSLVDISRYNFKPVSQFRHSYDGADTGKERFTEEELAKLISLYRDVQGRGYKSLFRSVSNSEPSAGGFADTDSGGDSGVDDDDEGLDFFNRAFGVD
jgi:hypothetical protein